MCLVLTSPLTVVFRDFTAPASLVFWLWICVPQTPAKFSQVKWFLVSCSVATLDLIYFLFKGQEVTWKVLLNSAVLSSSGGADKNVVVFDKNEEQIVATLKGHTKKVTSVIYHPSQVTFRVFKHPIMSALPVSAHCLHHLTLSLSPPVDCGLLCISRQHYPCVVRHWRQLCPGCACPRRRCHWTVPSCHWGLPAQLLWGSGVCDIIQNLLFSPCN